METFDKDLFMVLNFDGGKAIDNIMLAISGTVMWIPLYALILWLVWRKCGLRNMFLFLLALALAVVLSDMVAGIFKQTGLLGGLLPDLAPRPRPMFTPSLEGLDITPDSLRSMRHALPAHDWAVHVPAKAISGLYGTVSAHAATIVAIALLSVSTIRQRWFTWLMIACAIAICYSRIYLGKHYPMDIVWGTLLGLTLGYMALCGFRKAVRRWDAAAKS